MKFCIFALFLFSALNICAQSKCEEGRILNGKLKTSSTVIEQKLAPFNLKGTVEICVKIDRKGKVLKVIFPNSKIASIIKSIEFHATDHVSENYTIWGILILKFDEVAVGFTTAIFFYRS